MGGFFWELHQQDEIANAKMMANSANASARRQNRQTNMRVDDLERQVEFLAKMLNAAVGVMAAKGVCTMDDIKAEFGRHVAEAAFNNGGGATVKDLAEQAGASAEVDRPKVKQPLRPVSPRLVSKPKFPR